MELPHDLRCAIEHLCAGHSLRNLSQAYEALSMRYRRESLAAEGHDLFIRSQDEAFAYVASRLPATYAATTKAFEALQALAPDFQPQTLCDFGAGPGTAAFAAQALWRESLTQLSLLEPNLPLRLAGQGLAEQLGVSVSYDNKTLETYRPERQFDLVVASYVLNEVPAQRLEDSVRKLWNSAHKVLVLVETGTPHGYQTLMRARDILRTQDGAFLAAPCPHSGVCPVADTQNWCHFSVRVQRSSLHRRIKPEARLSFEDEKFSYLIVTREACARPAARIIGAPKGSKVLGLPLCHRDGHFQLFETSKRDPSFSRLKKLDWGETIEDGVISQDKPGE